MSSDPASVDPLAYDAEHDEPVPADAVDDSVGQAADEALPDLPEDKDRPHVRDWDHSRPIGPGNPIS
jgi:hypothetical protein